MNVYSLWVNLFSIMGADVQNLYSDISPCFYFVGVTEETILRDLAVSSCMSVQEGLFIQWEQQEVKAMRRIKKLICFEIVTNFTKH